MRGHSLFFCDGFMKKILLLSISLFIFAFSQFSEKVVSFNYEKQSNGDKKESARVYYEQAAASYIMVYDPLDQLIRMLPDHLLYFYPGRDIALIMNNPDALISTIPVQLFVNAGSEDLGLGAMGFVLDHYDLKQDSLIRSWEAKGKKRDEYIRIDVISKNKRVLKALSYDHQGELIKEVAYDDWMTLSNYDYPLNISVKEGDRTDNYHFNNVTLLQGIPDSVLNKYILPEDCEIHEYKF